jgi:hypothetical protein
MGTAVMGKLYSSPNVSTNSDGIHTLELASLVPMIKRILEILSVVQLDDLFFSKSAFNASSLNMKKNMYFIKAIYNNTVIEA